jgi:hypothetical protein
MSTFIDAIGKLRGKLVEVGTQGEWADRGELQSVSADHLVLQQAGSERIIIVKVDALEYVKEVPPSTARSTR